MFLTAVLLCSAHSDEQAVNQHAATQRLSRFGAEASTSDPPRRDEIGKVDLVFSSTPSIASESLLGAFVAVPSAQNSVHTEDKWRHLVNSGVPETIPTSVKSISNMLS